MRHNSYIININNPCSESWSDMTPANGGRFCAHCSKTVIDFSKLTDDEIVKIISQNKEKICGRFLETQLNKEIIETKQTHPSRGFYKYLAGVFLFSISKNAFSFPNNKINFSKENIVANPVQHKEISKEFFLNDTTVKVIKGRIFDSTTKQPLKNVFIEINTRERGIKDTEPIYGDATDSNGNYFLFIPHQFINQNIVLTVSLRGYYTRKFTIEQYGATNDYDFYLAKDSSELTREVAVLGYGVIKRKHHWWQFWK